MLSLRKWIHWLKNITFSSRYSLALVFIFLLIISIGIYQVSALVCSDTIYPGIIVDGTDISQLTRGEALQLLRENTERTIPKRAILLYSSFGQYQLPLDDIGYMPNYPEALDWAYLQGRTGNLIKRLADIHRIGKSGLHMTPEICYNIEKTERILESIQLDIEKKPENAGIRFENGKMEITPGRAGVRLDKEYSLARINGSLTGRTLEDVELCVVEVLPDITVPMVKKITWKIGKYQTVFNPDNEDRAHNIKTACSKINQKLLLPGEVFSMDRILGDRTEKNGYRQAKIIVNNKLVDGLGGGICQVTSTIYNAVLLSGLEIVERRNHSIPLSYIDMGRDATISQGYIDFKFKNNSGYAILVEAKVVSNQVYIALWGQEPEPKNTIMIRTKVIEEIPPEGIDVEFDDSMKPGVVEIKREAVPGYRVEVFRDTLDTAGQIIKTEKISVDKYLPQRKKVRVAPAAIQKTIKDEIVLP